jgi:hypothetical protein
VESARHGQVGFGALRSLAGDFERRLITGRSTGKGYSRGGVKKPTFWPWERAALGVEFGGRGAKTSAGSGYSQLSAEGQPAYLDTPLKIVDFHSLNNQNPNQGVLSTPKVHQPSLLPNNQNPYQGALSTPKVHQPSLLPNNQNPNQGALSTPKVHKPSLLPIQGP